MKISPNGFREYDARWLFEKDIDIDGMNDLGKGLGLGIPSKKLLFGPALPGFMLASIPSEQIE